MYFYARRESLFLMVSDLYLSPSQYFELYVVKITPNSEPKRNSYFNRQSAIERVVTSSLSISGLFSDTLEPFSFNFEMSTPQ